MSVQAGSASAPSEAQLPAEPAASSALEPARAPTPSDEAAPSTAAQTFVASKTSAAQDSSQPSQEISPAELRFEARCAEDDSLASKSNASDLQYGAGQAVDAGRERNEAGEIGELHLRWR